MKQVAKLGVLLIIVVLAGTPLLACMLPGGATTDEESACCREMASDCGHGNMSSHSCCQTASVPGQAAIAKASFELSVNLVYVGPPQHDFTEGSPETFRVVVSLGHSPPETPPASPEILRI